MKNLKPLPSLLAVVVGYLFLGNGQFVRAAGPAGSAGQSGVGTGTGVASAAPVGGGGRSSGGNGRSGGATAAGRPASNGSAVRSAGASGGASPSRFSSTAINSNAPRYLPGGIQPNVSGATGARSRSNPTLSTNRPASISRPVTATQQPAAMPQAARSFNASRPANAWTDSPTVNNRPGSRRAQADLYNRSAGAYRNYISNGNYNGLTTPDGFTGSVLYPGAYGSALNSYHDRLAPRGALVGSNQATNYARIQRWYGRDGRRYRYWPNGYSPYFGVASYPFFGGSYYGDAFGGTYSGNDGLITNPSLNNVDSSVATVDANAPAADLGSPAPVASNRQVQTGSLGTGPDSLVEAVQAELARRGYFQGKVDAIYGPTTKEALRRFQSERGLNVTGRVNEATLHALELD